MEVIVSISFGDNLLNEEPENYDDLETYEDVVVPSDDEKMSESETNTDPFESESNGGEYADAYSGDVAYNDAYAEQIEQGTEYAYQEPIYAEPFDKANEVSFDEPAEEPESSAEPVYTEPLYTEPVYAEPVYAEAHTEDGSAEQPLFDEPAHAEVAATVTEHVYEPTHTEAAVAERTYTEPARADGAVYDYSYYNYNDTSVHETNNTETNNYEIHNHYDVTYQMAAPEAAPVLAPEPKPEPEAVAPKPEVKPEAPERPSLAEFSVVGGAPFIPKTREEAERYLSVLLLIVDAAMADPETKDSDLEEIAVLIETARTESFREPADQEILAQCLQKLAGRWSK